MLNAASQTPSENIIASIKILRDLNIASVQSINKLEKWTLDLAKIWGFEMTKNEIYKELSSLKSEDELQEKMDDLVNKWTREGVGHESICEILRFMEDHPNWDFGMPGAFVHFVEKFYHVGYEQALVESIGRHPTAHTVWMLNRLINGEESAEKRLGYINLLRIAKNNKNSDEYVNEVIDEYLTFQMGAGRN